MWGIVLCFAVPAIAYGLMAFAIYVQEQCKQNSDPLRTLILWAMDSAISNPFTLMALGGASFFFYREVVRCCSFHSESEPVLHLLPRSYLRRCVSWNGCA